MKIIITLIVGVLAGIMFYSCSIYYHNLRQIKFGQLGIARSLEHAYQLYIEQWEKSPLDMDQALASYYAEKDVRRMLNRLNKEYWPIVQTIEEENFTYLEVKYIKPQFKEYRFRIFDSEKNKKE
jgi:uncharacterized membrane protein YraQ (UPF0718 family)